MKKLILLSIIVSLVSCNGFNENKLMKRWKFEKLITNGEDQKLNKGDILDIRDDYTCNYLGKEYSWKSIRDKTSLVLFNDKGVRKEFKIAKLSNDELILEATEVLAHESYFKQWHYTFYE